MVMRSVDPAYLITSLTPAPPGLSLQSCSYLTIPPTELILITGSIYWLFPLLGMMYSKYPLDLCFYLLQVFLKCYLLNKTCCDFPISSCNFASSVPKPSYSQNVPFSLICTVYYLFSIFLCWKIILWRTCIFAAEAVYIFKCPEQCLVHNRCSNNRE